MSFPRPFCKPHKCEKPLTVLNHVNRKPPSRANAFQLSPSSRHAPGLEESRRCEVSSAVLIFGQREILFLGISHPILPQLQTRGKQNTQGSSGERRGEGRREQGPPTTKVLQQVLQRTGRESLSKMSDQSDDARQRAGKQVMSQKREK